MTTYTNVFGNDTVPPSEYAYRAVALTADVTLGWPEIETGTNIVASLMNVTATGGAWTITLPAANQVSTGRDFVISNIGASTFTVVDNAGNPLTTILAGVQKYFYITDNTTAAGTWTVMTYGTGTSAADASALDGAGLEVISGQLSTRFEVDAFGGAYTVTASDRSRLLSYSGGTQTVYLADTASLTDGFFVAIANNGTGTLTVDANASQTIDGSLTKQLQPGESAFFVCDGSNWFTVGYGRSNEFEFTQLAVDVTGAGAITISSAQAANKLWYFYNTMSANRTVTIPAVASVYFVRVGAVGSYTLTFTTGSGATVGLTANQSYTIYCDGTNVVSAQTVAVTSAVALDDGSEGSPSLSFNLDPDTGFWRPGSNALAISCGGVEVARFTSSGLTLATPLSVANGGTGRATSTTAYGLIAAGTTATGAHQTLAAGLTTEILVGGGASALPVWTAATGSGAPVRATSPSIASPTITGTWTANGATCSNLGTVTTADINGGTIDNAAIGGATPAAGAFTTLSATGQITSTVSTGTPPFVVSSTTQVANLNAATAGTAGSATTATTATNVAGGAAGSLPYQTGSGTTGMLSVGAVGTLLQSTGTAPSWASIGSIAASTGIYWLFDSSTSMADPGTGDLRLNNASPGSVTAIAVSANSADTGNPAVRPFVLTWDDSTDALKATLIVRKSSAPENFAIYSVTGASTDNTTWVQLAVTYVNGSGTFSNGDGLVVQYARTGDAGVDGVATNYTVSTQTATGGQTTFSITYTVGFIDVYQNGSRLIPTTDYTATNGTSVVLNTGATLNDELTFVVWTAVTMVNALTAADIGVSVQPFGQVITWEKKTTGFTAVVGKAYYCDTTSAGFTVTLPLSPSTNNAVRIAGGPAASTNNLTVDRNGSTIMGLSENMTISDNNVTADFIYDGTTWRIA